MSERNPHDAPGDWQTAFATLPQEDPPRGGWDAVASRLAVRRRRRRQAGAAIAAALLLAAVLPWRLLAPGDVRPGADMPALAAAPDGVLSPLHAESAWLVTLLRQLRDERVASGAAALIGDELESRLAVVDMALARPGLDPAEEVALWEQRLGMLRDLVDFEGTRLWLAANGHSYDPVLLVHVD